MNSELICEINQFCNEEGYHQTINEIYQEDIENLMKIFKISTFNKFIFKFTSMLSEIDFLFIFTIYEIGISLLKVEEFSDQITSLLRFLVQNLKLIPEDFECEIENLVWDLLLTQENDYEFFPADYFCSLMKIITKYNSNKSTFKCPPLFVEELLIKLDSHNLFQILNIFYKLNISGDQFPKIIEESLNLSENVPSIDLTRYIRLVLNIPTTTNLIFLLKTLIKQLDSKFQDDSTKDRMYECMEILVTRFNLLKADVIRAFLRNMKSLPTFDESLLCSFSMAFYLYLAKRLTFREESLIKVIAQSIVGVIRSSHRASYCHWLSKILPSQIGVEKLLINLAERSDYFYAVISQEIVRITTELGTMAFGEVEGVQKVIIRTCMVVVLKMFTINNEDLRSFILESVCQNIIPCENNASRLFIDMLNYMQKYNLEAVITRANVISPFFENLTLLSHQLIGKIVRCCLPLLKETDELRSILFKNLKKLLISNNSYSKRAAVMSYIHIIRYLPTNVSSLTQFSSSFNLTLTVPSVKMTTQQTSLFYDAVYSEISSYLRTAIKQDALTKRIIYTGLPLAIGSNSVVDELVYNMVVTQLEKYYEADSELLPPLDFSCVYYLTEDDVLPNEPLDVLVQCAVVVTNYMKGADCSQLRGMISSIVVRMLKCNPEDFGLVKSVDSDVRIMKKDSIVVSSICRTCDALIEWLLTNGGSHQNAVELLDLQQNFKNHYFNSQQKVLGRKSSNLPVTPLLTLDGSMEIITKQFNNDSDSLRLANYVLSSFSTSLSDLRVNSEFVHCKHQIYTYLLEMARYCLKYCVGCSTITNTRNNENLMELIVLSFECLAIIFDYIYDNFNFSSKDFLESLVDVLESSDLDNSNDRLVSTFQRLFVTTLEYRSGRSSWRELLAILSLIKNLVLHTNLSFDIISQMTEWFSRISSQYTFSDLKLLREFLVLYFQCARQTSKCYSLMGEITSHLYSFYGDIDKVGFIITLSVNVPEVGDKFGVVNDCSSASVTLNSVLRCVGLELDEIHWLYSVLRSEQANLSSVVSLLLANLSYNFGSILSLVYDLVQIAMPSSLHLSSFLRLITRMYSLSSDIVQHAVLCVGHDSSAIMSDRFCRFLTALSHNFTPRVYLMITYVQAFESERIGSAYSKKRKLKVDKDSSDYLAKDCHESKLIPKLVYSIENYERQLLNLSVKSKIDLLKGMKISKSRDFKIDQSLIEDYDS